jgi:DNA-binding beta-propeller fold protein YncE
MKSWIWTLSLALLACEPTEEQDPPVDTTCEPAPGRICGFAGTGDNGWNLDGKDKSETMFSFPMGITFSPYGNPVLADWNNHKIREIRPDGTVHTIMGTDFLGDGDAAALDLTAEGADGTSVNLNHPTMQVYLSDGTLVSDSWHTHKLRTWDPATGKVHVVLGRGAGFAPPEPMDDRSAPRADTGCLLNQPKEIALDAAENVYILDMRNERIRYWDREALTMRTVAGSGLKGNDPANAATCATPSAEGMSYCFSFPKNSNPEPGGAMALSEDASVMYIADTEASVILELDLASGAIAIVAGGYQQAGFADGAASDARFNFPTDLELDGTTLFVADANNNRVRAIDLTTGQVSTVAGTGEATCESGGAAGAGDSTLTVHPGICDEQKTAGDGGPAVDATLFRPMAIALDLDGNLVVADTYNHRYRVIYR